MQSIEKRIVKLETTNAPKLSGAALLASLWAELARHHPCIRARVEKRANEKRGPAAPTNE